TLSSSEQRSLIEKLSLETGKSVAIGDVNLLDISSFGEILSKVSGIPLSHIDGVLYRHLPQFFWKEIKVISIPFADTNWPFFWFSFVVNPISKQVEIWRESFDKRITLPMTEWDDPYRKEKEGWILFLE